MVSLKTKQSGFTIVELLIVIVVIGILAALVITTFSGIQQRGRNAERQTDINAVAGQLEGYYARNGSYPALADVNAAAWRASNEFRLDTKALADPNNAGSEVLIGTAPAANSTTYSYSYEALPAACTTGNCTSYTLTANLENDDTTNIVKKSN